MHCSCLNTADSARAQKTSTFIPAGFVVGYSVAEHSLRLIRRNHRCFFSLAGERAFFAVGHDGQKLRKQTSYVHARSYVHLHTCVGCVCVCIHKQLRPSDQLHPPGVETARPNSFGADHANATETAHDPRRRGSFVPPSLTHTETPYMCTHDCKLRRLKLRDRYSASALQYAAGKPSSRARKPSYHRWQYSRR